MDKSIRFTGINRAMPSQGVADGACQEIINLRLRKGAWRPVGSKKLYRGMDGDNFSFIVTAGLTNIFLHDIDNSLLAGVPNWIGYNRLTGELSLLDLTQKTLTHLETLPPQTDVRVVFLKRTMIVTCETSLTTFLWTSDKLYTRIQTLTVPDVTLSVLPDSSKPMRVETDFYERALLNEIPKAFLGEYFTGLSDENRVYGSCFGSILYIVALRMFDGSYILPSIPKYLNISNTGNISVFRDLHENEGFDFLKYTLDYDVARIQVTIKDQYSDPGLDSAKDIIDSVCVFATRLTPLHQIDESTISEEALAFYPGSGGEVEKLFQDFFPINSDFKALCKSESFYKIHEFNFETLTTATEDITQEVDMKDYYKNYATRDVLPTDQMTHHSIHSKVAMVYNDRLHLYNIRTMYGLPYIQWQAPLGYSRQGGTPGTITVWLKTALGQVVVNAPVSVPLYMQGPEVVYGTELRRVSFDDESSAQFFMQLIEESPGMLGYPTYVPNSAHITFVDGNHYEVLFDITVEVQPDLSLARYFLPGIVGYNDARAYRMQLVVGGDNGFLFEDKLTKNPGMNYSFWHNPAFSPNPLDTESNYPYRQWNANEALIPGYIPTPLTTGFDTNRLQVSEIQNPMVFPARYSYQVGTGDGLALAAGSEPLSTGQFGQFPLQAFSSKGIWALEIGNNDFLYSHVLPVNGEVINNPNNVIPIGMGVVYTTQKGVFIIAGRDVQEISEVVEGSIDLNFIQLPEVQGAVSMPNFISLSSSLSLIPFLSYLSESKMGYDHLNRELLITNQNYRYSYIFSFESNTWTKVSPVYRLLVNAYPTLLGFTQDSCMNVSEEETAGFVDTLLITRPLSLDAPDFYKKIERCVLRADCSPGQGRTVGWYLFASDDLNTWQFITGIQRMGSNLQDFMFQRSNGSAKYYILVFAGNISPSGEINRTDVTLSPRWMHKLR